MQINCQKIKKIDLLDVMEAEANEYSAFFQSVSKENELAQFDLLFSTDDFFSASQQDIKNIDISHQQKLAQNLTGQSQDSTNNMLNQLPFIGGYLVFISYEFNQIIYPRLHIPHHPANLNNPKQPIYLAKVNHALILNHLKQKLYYLAENQSVMSRLKNQVQRAIDSPYSKEKQKIQVFKKNDFNQADKNYLAAVKLAKKHIYRGDIYQANLSTGYEFKLVNNDSPFKIYRSLRKSNPAPFLALVNIANFSIISSSPERLLKLKNGELSTRPIAGTIDRSSNLKEDKKKIIELNQSSKDKSEHMMLVDLERNDLSKIALNHSLKVSERFIETHPFIHHLVSEIKVKIAPYVDLFEVLSSVFPGGSITGCPKIRCMEIIRDIEQTPRFAYTGSVGYISNDGQMDFNILIRTLFLENKNLSFRVGGGIVADSEPNLELQETKNKAIGLLAALEIIKEKN